MTDAALTLGPVEFKRLEVPERISVGGDQAMAVHKMVGGRRVIHTMGRDDIPLEWSGRFTEADGLTRARQLDAYRIAGKAMQLSWSELSFNVVIKRFVYHFERDWFIPYDITLEIVEDRAQPVGANSDPSIDDMIAGDNATAGDLGDLIGDAGISSGLSTLSTAISNVSDIATASRAAINTILDPLGTVQDAVTALIASTDAVTAVSSLGGVVAGAPAAVSAANLLTQASAMTELGQLYDLDATLGRMQTNLENVTVAGAQIVQAGGDLYRIAEAAYGDSSEWPGIALANNLTDPFLTGLNTILVPPTPSGSGGVLQP